MFKHSNAGRDTVYPEVFCSPFRIMLLLWREYAVTASCHVLSDGFFVTILSCDTIERKNTVRVV